VTLLFATSGVPRVIAKYACIAYDPVNGEIMHVHFVTTLEGGEVPSEDSIRETTLEHARTLFRGPPRQTVETVFVEPDELRPHTMYRIDRQTTKLIAMPLETPRK
jgi:hypothetical protein